MHRELGILFLERCSAAGAAMVQHMRAFFFCKWNILFEIQTALIIETDIALDFERYLAVDIG